MVTTQTKTLLDRGLLHCHECDRLVTPGAMTRHLERVHGKHICHKCGVDVDEWMFKEKHECEEEK